MKEPLTKIDPTNGDLLIRKDFFIVLTIIFALVAIAIPASILWMLS